MKIRLLLAFAFLAALAAQGARAQSFPEGDVFRPLVADPNETRSYLSLINVDSEHDQQWIGDVGVGANLGFYRWGGARAGDGLQIGIFAAVQSQFAVEQSSYPLVNTDYRVGFPLTYRSGDFSARARLFHQSSHLGDEFILQGRSPQRVNLSVEVIDLLLAWDIGNWRPYIGGGYLFHVDPDTLNKGAFQAGVDYIGTRPALWGGRLVGGVDYRAFDENDWRAGISAKVGLEFGRPLPNRRGLAVLLEAYDGPAPYGQFYRDVVTYYGVALQFHH